MRRFALTLLLCTLLAVAQSLLLGAGPSAGAARKGGAARALQHPPRRSLRLQSWTRGGVAPLQCTMMQHIYAKTARGRTDEEQLGLGDFAPVVDPGRGFKTGPGEVALKTK